ncbi:MAG: DNA-binding protein [archaeon]|nr:DNA-binding protein [archaeon]
MKSVEMKKGRTFVLTLETGESIKAEIEGFCKTQNITCAKVTVIGGVGAGSTFVSGPMLVDGKETEPIKPLTYTTDAPAEFAGVGTVFPDESGNPVMHLHGSLGRNGMSVTGCFRDKALAWLTLEVIIEELTGDAPVRKMDPVKAVAPLWNERFLTNV